MSEIIVTLVSDNLMQVSTNSSLSSSIISRPVLGVGLETAFLGDLALVDSLEAMVKMNG
jgi:hypothetical protein